VPHWAHTHLDASQWSVWLAKAAKRHQSEPVSLYIHLPYCEQLCTYCACNKRITVNHAVEKPYIEAVLAEWQWYLQHWEHPPVIAEIHLGGGTPTFFSPENLSWLTRSLLEASSTSNFQGGSFEAHPANTTHKHLIALWEAGFRRISVGVQDFDPEVQYIINRVQTVEETEAIVNTARRVGFSSVNIDIVYGLPRQTLKSVTHTVAEVLRLRPERIAFYSYAHVPWKSAGQRRYTEADLPQGAEKRALYELGRAQLLEAGYVPVGFDHFALPNDELANPVRLHRNFMGYTTQPQPMLIGLGCSSISNIGGSFGQNAVSVEAYKELIATQGCAVVKGHEPSSEDQILQTHILNLMCRAYTHWNDNLLYTPFLDETVKKLRILEADGLVHLADKEVRVSEAGRDFLRNICMCFDARLHRGSLRQEATFSRSV
jgi:oxygen-independent coproporphyrinogen-3 oxidase